MEQMALILFLGACGPLGAMATLGEPTTHGYQEAASPSEAPTPGHQAPPGGPVTVGGTQLDETGEAPIDLYEDHEPAENWTLEEPGVPSGSPEPDTPSPSPEPEKAAQGPTSKPRGRGATLERSRGQERAASAPLPYCTCDLSPGTCDINCCCDSDCGLSDPLAVFSYCLPGSTKAVSQVCVDSTLLFRNNTPLATTNNATETPDQFCVQTNDANLNYFVQPQNVTETTFKGLVAEYGRRSFIQPDQSAPSTPPFYKVGDPVLTLSYSSALGVLSQPVARGPGGECTDKNPAGFLQSRSSSCLRRVAALNLSCTSDLALNADSYYKNFTVVKVPNAVNTSASQQVTITTSPTPATPSMVNGSCINVVSQVSYVIDYDGTRGIQSVSVDFTFTSLTGESGSSFPQSFTVFFRSSPQIAQNLVPRSGNPGYVVGAPLLTSVDGTRRSVTLPQSQSDGTCSDQVTANALFGVNMRTGCRFSKVASDTCAGFAEQLQQALLGPESPKSLAMFGNADPSVATGWTNVIYTNCTNQGAGNCSTGCTVPVSVEIQVLWAQVGLRSNPQSQLLGARYQNYCKLLKCQSPVVLETVLSFIDTTLKSNPPRGQPATDWKLPFDFFFPFEVALSGGAVLGRGSLDAFLFSCAALTLHCVFRP